MCIMQEEVVVVEVAALSLAEKSSLNIETIEFC